VDYKHVGSVERGEKPPSFEAVEKLAAALKVDFYELFLPAELPVGRGDADLRIALREIERRGDPKLSRFLTQVLTGAVDLSKV
jgi:transcriptional regulator with XRE-family HTH domain